MILVDWEVESGEEEVVCSFDGGGVFGVTVVVEFEGCASAGGAVAELFLVGGVGGMGLVGGVGDSINKTPL